MSYKAKINLAVLLRYKNPENQYMSHKKYDVHLGLSGPFDLVCLQYPPLARACSPTTRTENSTLGLKGLYALDTQYTIFVLRPQNEFCGPYRGREIFNVKQFHTFSISQLPYGKRNYILRPSDKKIVYIIPWTHRAHQAHTRRE